MACQKVETTTRQRSLGATLSGRPWERPVWTEIDQGWSTIGQASAVVGLLGDGRTRISSRIRLTRCPTGTLAFGTTFARLSCRRLGHDLNSGIVDDFTGTGFGARFPATGVTEQRVSHWPRSAYRPSGARHAVRYARQTGKTVYQRDLSQPKHQAADITACVAGGRPGMHHAQQNLASQSIHHYFDVPGGTRLERRVVVYCYFGGLTSGSQTS